MTLTFNIWIPQARAVILNETFKYLQPVQWHWFKYLYPSSQPCRKFNPSIWSAREEDVAIAMSRFLSHILTGPSPSSLSPQHSTHLGILYFRQQLQSLLDKIFVQIIITHTEGTYCNFGKKLRVLKTSGHFKCVRTHDQIPSAKVQQSDWRQGAECE